MLKIFHSFVKELKKGVVLIFFREAMKGVVFVAQEVR